MNYLAAILVSSVVILGMYGITSTIEKSNEINNVQESTEEKRTKAVKEIQSIKASVDDSGVMRITNDGSSDTKIIQYRVYDDDGNLLDTFSANDTIKGANEEKISLPLELTEKLK